MGARHRRSSSPRDLLLADTFWLGTVTDGPGLGLVFMSFVLVTGHGRDGQPGPGHVRHRRRAGGGLLVDRYDVPFLPALAGRCPCAAVVWASSRGAARPAPRRPAARAATLALALLGEQVLFKWNWLRNGRRAGPSTGPTIGPFDLDDERTTFAMFLLLLTGWSRARGAQPAAFVGGRAIDAVRAVRAGGGDVGPVGGAVEARHLRLSAGLAGLGGVLVSAYQREHHQHHVPRRRWACCGWPRPCCSASGGRAARWSQAWCRRAASSGCATAAAARLRPVVARLGRRRRELERGVGHPVRSRGRPTGPRPRRGAGHHRDAEPRPPHQAGQGAGGPADVATTAPGPAGVGTAGPGPADAAVHDVAAAGTTGAVQASVVAVRSQATAVGGDGWGTSSPVPRLELRGVRSGYGPVEVLHGVDLELRAGTITALLGPNGAGKSTLCLTVAGLVPVTEGSIRYEGADITSIRGWRRARRGLVLAPELRGVFPGLSVEENLLVWLPDSKDREGVYERFPLLSDRRSLHAGFLSGGEQQILTLAPLLQRHPDVLIADEPSLGLAPIIVEQLMRLFEELRDAGVALLLVEEKARDVVPIADEVAFLELGQIGWQGARHDVDPAASPPPTWAPDAMTRPPRWPWFGPGCGTRPNLNESHRPSGGDDVPPTDAALDRIEIRDLLSRIAIATDRRDWSAFGACFIPDASADYGELSNGTIGDALAVLGPMLEGYTSTMNFVGTQHVDIDGDTARAETYVLSYHRRGGDNPTDDVAGTRYLDDMVRTPQGWLVARRTTELMWFRPSDPVGA